MSTFASIFRGTSRHFQAAWAVSPGCYPTNVPATNPDRSSVPDKELPPPEEVVAFQQVSGWHRLYRLYGRVAPFVRALADHHNAQEIG